MTFSALSSLVLDAKLLALRRNPQPPSKRDRAAAHQKEDEQHRHVSSGHHCAWIFPVLPESSYSSGHRFAWSLLAQVAAR